MEQKNSLSSKILPIVLCLAAGYSLRFLNEYLDLQWNHALQDFLIVAFVMMGFWRKKTFALILSLFTVLALGIIEIFSPLQWDNLLRAILIIVLAIFLVLWSKKLSKDSLNNAKNFQGDKD